MEKLTENELKQTEMGQNGGVLMTDTTAVTGNWRKMVVLTNAAFTTLTTEYTKNGISFAAAAADWGTLAAGTVICGRITAVKLTSGCVLLMV